MPDRQQHTVGMLSPQNMFARPCIAFIWYIFSVLISSLLFLTYPLFISGVYCSVKICLALCYIIFRDYIKEPYSIGSSWTRPPNHPEALRFHYWNFRVIWLDLPDYRTCPLLHVGLTGAFSRKSIRSVGAVVTVRWLVAINREMSSCGQTTGFVEIILAAGEAG